MREEQKLLPAPESPKLLPAPKGRTSQAVSPGRRNRVVAIVVGALLVLLIIGWFFHHREAAKAKEANDRARERIPSVSVVRVKASGGTSDLLLPGSITAITEASLFARASGYLTSRYADIGDVVRRGQILAQIDSPDLDQQVLQGRAAVAQARQQASQTEAMVGDAKARVDLAVVTHQRLLALVKDQAVSQQDVDQARQSLDTARASLSSTVASVAAARENVRAAQASAERLTVLQGYEQLRAPFDGVITARNIDEGAFINNAGGSSAQSATTGLSGSNSGTSTSASASGSASTTSASGSGGGNQGTSSAGTELFRIAQVDRLRVFVSVPQDNAAAVSAGNAASVYVQGFPEAFAGRITRTANAIDPNARTLLTEVEIPNASRRLYPGMYAQVRFQSPRAEAPLLVPGEAVIARADGLSVAVIEELRPEDRARLPKGKGQAKDDSGDTATGSAKGVGKEGRADGDGDTPDHAKRIRMQRVQVGRDYGTEVEIVRGLQAGAQVVSNPGDDVAEDALVIPKERKPASESGDSPGSAQPPSGNESPSMKAPTQGKSGGKGKGKS